MKPKEVTSSFQKRPAYRYIRATDKLPTVAPDGTEVAKVKLFNPTGAGTWYLASYDPDTGIAFGVADLGYGPEAGDIYIPELVEFRGRFGLPIERDLSFKPVKLAAILNPPEVVAKVAPEVAAAFDPGGVLQDAGLMVVVP